MPSTSDRMQLQVQGCSFDFRVRSFAGREALSRLFSFQVEFLTDQNASSSFQDLVGQPATLTLINESGEERYFHGIVGRVALGRVGSKARSGRIEIVPKLWLLTRRSDVRIFQSMTAPVIIQKVLEGAGLASGDDFKVSVQGTYATREYCVQYRETDFNFISRLMEHEGIFYYFQQTDSGHTMILADRNSSLGPITGTSSVVFRDGSTREDHINVWDHQFEVRSGKWTMRDYNFTTPAVKLESTTQSSTFTNLELYDYPGEYGVPGDGDSGVKTRIEEEEVGINVANGASGCLMFAPGYTFTLTEHMDDSENATYLITSVDHSASTPYEDIQRESVETYSNLFSCIPSSVPFRPTRITPKPVVQGLQTAVVVGPSGEDIYVDQYGRVKVQFFWDRLGKLDENSSCWIRVAQPWSGKAWGGFFYPRIKQEVVVDFLEGDPDRPLIVGSVYNADQVVPYALPANKTQSGFKTRTSPDPQDASISNEIRFEDKKGSEEIFIHGQKDWTIAIVNDKNQTVGHDETLEVKNDRTKKVDHDENVTIGNNLTAEVKNNESTTIDSNSTWLIKKDQSVTVNGNASEQVDKQKNVKVGDQIYIECGQANITIKKDGSIAIQGAKLSVTMTGDIQTQADGNVSIKSTGNTNIEATGNLTAKATGNADVQASGKVSVKGSAVAIN